MTRTLELLEQAVDEAEEATGWYADRSASVASAFVAALEHAFSAIQHTPASGPSFAHGTRRFLLKRFPYYVVYLRRLSDEKRSRRRDRDRARSSPTRLSEQPDAPSERHRQPELR